MLAATVVVAACSPPGATPQAPPTIYMVPRSVPDGWGPVSAAIPSPSTTTQTYLPSNVSGFALPGPGMRLTITGDSTFDAAVAEVERAYDGPFEIAAGKIRGRPAEIVVWGAQGPVAVVVDEGDGIVSTLLGGGLTAQQSVAIDESLTPVTADEFTLFASR